MQNSASARDRALASEPAASGKSRAQPREDLATHTLEDLIHASWGPSMKRAIGLSATAARAARPSVIEVGRGFSLQLAARHIALRCPAPRKPRVYIPRAGYSWHPFGGRKPRFASGAARATDRDLANAPNRSECIARNPMRGHCVQNSSLHRTGGTLDISSAASSTAAQGARAALAAN